MTAMTDNARGQLFLRAVESDIRKFLIDGEGINPAEFFEDVHIALIEEMELLGIEVDEPEADAFADDALIDAYEDMQHAKELENFDPITHIEAQEKLTKTI